MGLSSARSGTGKNSGWARQQNEDQLPIATAMAGVNMHLAPNAYRELHWHSANEWSYILNGSVRIGAVNENGESFVDDLNAGDVWFFPAGVPHTIQAFGEGVEFLLIFDQGDFSEDDTDLVSELFLRNPREVLAKNLQTDISNLDDLPSDQLYIFNGTPAPSNISEQNITGPAGYLPKAQAYSYHFSQQDAYETPSGGGSVRILDPTTFPIASSFAVAIFTIKPGAMREIHWHTTSPEWSFFISGRARVTVFSGPDVSRTFDFSAGDVGYVPAVSSHYVENTGHEDVVYLEVLQADKYSDISVNQWLALTGRQIVKDTLGLSDAVLDGLSKSKTYIVPGNEDLLTTNFTVGDGLS